MNLETLLQSLGKFVFYSQNGNMGDLLIGEGTRQLFSRLGLQYWTHGEDKLPDKYTLVHSGGARFTSNWCKIDDAIHDLCNEHVEKCIILPHSFYNVDELLAHFDDRHIIFCRDKYSYEYCKTKCIKSQVYLSDDMAFYLRLIDVRPVSTENAEGYCITPDECETLESIKHGLFKTMHDRVQAATISATLNGKEKKIAFLLRTDSEKGVILSCPLAYDIPIAWHTTGSNMMFNGNILRQFSHAIKQAEVIVSDRLHVCIMAYLSGREVYMLDNNYGKVRGVYELSLANKPMIHLLADGKLPPELEAAWQKLTTEHARREAWTQSLRYKAWVSTLVILGKCKRFLKRPLQSIINAVRK